MNLTAEQRYNQAITLARRISKREVEDLIAGRINSTEMCGMDRERKYLIREIGRAFDAGVAAAIRSGGGE